jgi:hypothetical protein
MSLTSGAGRPSLLFFSVSLVLALGPHAVRSTVVLAAGSEPPAAAAPAVRRAAGPAQSAAAEPLIHSEDLVYEGAFRVPQGPIAGSSFDYGGTAMTFNPAHGSLFVVGHPWQQQVAEIAIPVIRRATSLRDLAVAQITQPFADITEGRRSSVGNNPGSDTTQIGGLLSYGDLLYATVYLYYDASGSQQRSHFVSGLDFAVRGDVRGPYRVSGPGTGFVSGYFAVVPEEWQAALGGPVLNGQCCIPIIGRTSFGPAAVAIDPAQIGVHDPAPATPLVYYPGDHPTLGEWDAANTTFNGATQMAGVVFPIGTRSVLFFGRQGLGPFCYGEATNDPRKQGARVSQSGDDKYCYDPTNGSKGTHAYPYASYVWAYDANDLASVKSGRRRPWDVKPYATWSLDLDPFTAPSGIIGGVAYDSKTGRIYIAQDHGDGSYPLMHAFTIKN